MVHGPRVLVATADEILEDFLERDETHLRVGESTIASRHRAERPCCGQIKTCWRPFLYSRVSAMEIMLVEDNAGDAVLIRQILAESAVPVNLHIALDGEQALTMITGGHFRPELIILDLNIPRITGTALLERWKSEAIPVVVFSSSLNDAERRRALELGAREFVRKPTDVDEFIAVVTGILDRYAGEQSKSVGGIGA